MTDTNALSYVNLQDAVIEKRFPSSARGSVKQWLAMAYSNVWDAADWQFKHVQRAPLTVSSSQPTTPAGLAKVTRIYDDLGDPLEQLDQHTFDDWYADPSLGTGRPEAFTVVNRQIVVAPAPGSSYSFQITYVRRLAHKAADGAISEGFFTTDSDYPFWDDHHGILIPRAAAIGLKLRNDPTWEAVQDDYLGQLELMVNDLAVDVPPGAEWLAPEILW